MPSWQDIALFLAFLWAIWKVFSWLSRRETLPSASMIRAASSAAARLRRSEETRRSRPLTSRELRHIAAAASHDACRVRGWRGHWMRQRIRKRILDGWRVRYTMR